jgi:SWI/SNF-related matrix-associated actin-dependent regulator 1 of chromatin subfamily A
MSGNRLTITCQRIGKSSKYGIFFPFDAELINKIKALPQEERKYEANYKLWKIGIKSLFEIIKSYKGATDVHFDFGSTDSRKVFIDQIKKIEAAEFEKQRYLHELNKKKKWWVEFKNKLENEYKQYSDQVHSVLKPDIHLYPHQIVASLFVNETRNALISHEMGLGKTLVAIAYTEMNHFKKVIVLTPNSLKFNFYNEVEKFSDSKAYVINWKKNKYTIAESKYIIINYDYFNPKGKEDFDRKFNALNIGKIDALIADECQKLKNIKSNTYKNFKRVFKDDIFRDGKISKVFLSGTPAPNRAHELYSVLNQISYFDFPTKKYFYEYYCGMTRDMTGGYGWTVDEQMTKFEELFHKIAPYTHRKRKFEALPDLPEKVYQKIMIELSDNDYITYNRIEAGVANDFLEHPTSNPLTIMVRLRQYTASLKLSYLIELVDEILDSGEKVVIVDYFKDSLHDLKNHYGDIAALHTGDQTVEERADIVAKFQNPNSDLKIFLGSIQTCNYGLTLTAASKLFIITLPYSVGEYDQVADRLHRIGQLSSVNIYPVIFRETIDEYVYDLIEGKRKEIVKVIDNEDYVSDVKESVIGEVIAKIKKKHGK